MFWAMTGIDLSDACNWVNREHNMTPDIVISWTEKNISSMLICNVKRTDTWDDDTWTGTWTSSPFLLEIDFHYQVDMLGSRQRASK